MAITPLGDRNSVSSPSTLNVNSPIAPTPPTQGLVANVVSLSNDVAYERYTAVSVVLLCLIIPR